MERPVGQVVPGFEESENARFLGDGGIEGSDEGFDLAQPCLRGCLDGGIEEAGVDADVGADLDEREQGFARTAWENRVRVARLDLIWGLLGGILTQASANSGMGPV